jgi:hypothetical protein
VGVAGGLIVVAAQQFDYLASLFRLKTEIKKHTKFSIS